MDGEIRIAGTVKDSIVDGPGLRFTLFTQGCPHHCPGCHNPNTHDLGGGKIATLDEIYKELKSDKGITGVTFSGGDPFWQAKKLLPLAKQIKEDGYELAMYSGWTFEQLNDDIVPGAKELLAYADILVDGRFILEQKSLELSFRGSKNQRIVDVQKSLQLGFAVSSNNPEWNYKERIYEDEFAPKNIHDFGQ